VTTLPFGGRGGPLVSARVGVSLARPLCCVTHTAGTAGILPLSHSINSSREPLRPKTPACVRLEYRLSLSLWRAARRQTAAIPHSGHPDTRARRKRKTCQRQRRHLLATSPFPLSHARLLLTASRAGPRPRMTPTRTISLQMAEAGDIMQTPHMPMMPPPRPHRSSTHGRRRRHHTDTAHARAS